MTLAATQRRSRRTLPGMLCALAAVAAIVCCGIRPAFAADEAPKSSEVVERLIDRDPFDRVTLDGSNDNAVLETKLLDLPNRQVPNPLPEAGTFQLYRLSQPSQEYVVPWNSIDKIELYEGMVLAEAMQLTAKKEFAEAFEYLAFLHRYYKDMPGLEEASQTHLIQDAAATYAAGDLDQALSVLAALYVRNPSHPGLSNAVPLVTNRLLAGYLEKQNYAGARAVLDQIGRSFPKMQLANVADWRRKFEDAARDQLELGQLAFEAEKYSEARKAVQAAREILPDLPAARDLLAKVQAAAPEVRVGVSGWGPMESLGRGMTRSEKRIAELVNPQLVELIGFGAEGGDYACPWGSLETNDAGINTMLRLDGDASTQGVEADALVRTLLETAEPRMLGYSPVMGDLLAGVALVDGRSLSIDWRRPHIRPEALLQAPLRGLASAGQESPLWYSAQEEQAADVQEVRYQRGVGTDATQPRYVVERAYPDDDSAVGALARGDIDVLDRVPAWQLDRVAGIPGVRVEPYRLPTVHVLAINFENPLLATREFRRALCYAINRDSTVNDLLLGGAKIPGFRTLSGPFPAGASLNDPVAYAYKQELEPRPYEPRLASVLSTVARSAIAKRDAAMKPKPKPEEDKPAEPASEEAPEGEAKEEPPKDEKPKLPPMKPLVLAYRSDPVAQLACQTIKLQLDQAGLPVELREIAPGQPLIADPEQGPGYDLLYLELAIREPVVDARKVLGPGGVAGHSTAYMNFALDRLDQARNWKEASAQLKEIHQIAHFDLPLIPLWQTINHFAYRDYVSGIQSKPISLYQNLRDWRKDPTGGAR